MTPEETSLRTLWTSQGVTQERQDAMIAEIISKAQPGAHVGPFVIGESAEERRAREFREWARAPFPPTGESFPVHQMGPDGKRRARYRGGVK